MTLGRLGAIPDLRLDTLFFTLHTCLMENIRNRCSLGHVFRVFLTLLSPLVTFGYFVTSIFVNTQFSKFSTSFPLAPGGLLQGPRIQRYPPFCYPDTPEYDTMIPGHPPPAGEKHLFSTCQFHPRRVLLIRRPSSMGIEVLVYRW